MSFDGKYYIDRSLAFGTAHGTAIFQRITDAIRRILAHENIPVYNYIDDIFVCAEDAVAQKVFHRLKSLIQELGLPINNSKIVTPDDILTCMGIEVNAAAKTVKLPKEKMGEIAELCNTFQGRNKCSKRELQSLLGKLLYLAKIIIPARGFLNRMLQYLRGHNDSATVHLGEPFHKDLTWFRRLLSVINPQATYRIIDERVIHDVYVDASLQGFGAAWGTEAYSEQVPQTIKQDKGIVHFEMYNAWLAINVWGKRWKNSMVRIFCDNEAVVRILNSYKTKDPFLATFLRNIMLLLARFNIHLVCTHIKGVENDRADALSRLSQDNKHEWVRESTRINSLGKQQFSLDYDL